ncbi:S8 family peptidase [Solirubrobacter soli]|uniref:S8 family peptidase n=1 Tax=Solirubrobacter soli TaxID=363832 RepID=UPI0004273F98|nr:S8 family peptidase [Solirubrobacter soli]
MAQSTSSHRRRFTRIAGLAAAGVLAAAAPAFADDGQILRENSPDAIPESYIVVLDQDTGGQTTNSVIRELSDEHGADVDHKFTSSVKGFSAEMTREEALELSTDPAVAFVEQNRTIDALTDQPNPPSWGLDRIDQRALPLNNTFSYPDTGGAGVTAYIIDTGIQTTHAAFGGRASWGTNTVDATSSDCNGHGTHVAGTVGGAPYGVAKNVKLVAVKVLGCSGSGTTAGVVAGIDWVTAQHAAGQPAVANMSLGGGASTALDQAVQRSIADGVTYAIASGNSNANACNASPARVPEAITVNASTNTDARASFSNFGTCTDIFAPGQDITSAWIGTNTATNTISGTSMATPHVAGAAALLLAATPQASPAAIATALKANATAGAIANPGTGSPNLLLFTGATGPQQPPACAAATNNADFAIPDLGTASSPITVTGCARNASATAKVTVHIVHTFRGDLVVDLVAPNGTVRNLLNRSGGSADNVDQTFTVDLSAFPANGTWNLRVRDAAAADTGRIDAWTIEP